MIWAGVIVAASVSWLLASRRASFPLLIAAVVAGSALGFCAVSILANSVKAGAAFSELVFIMGEDGARKVLNATALQGVKASAAVAIACAILGYRSAKRRNPG